ncbi:hypothetical protein RB195_010056 [Necator americanus]|uniref:F-box domain-containing protein n=1 Tax=Necator americanus TaxID=51031 RepID=A0ABR1CWL8_NECAM
MNGSVVAPFPEKHGDDITKKLARKVSVAIIRFLSSVVICYPRKLHTVYERGKRLEELPNEILLKILSYCDFTSKMNMRAVNYRLYTLVETGAFTLVRRNLIGGVEIMDGCRSTDNTFDTGIPSSYYSSYHLTLSRPLKRVQLLVPAARLTNIMRHVSVCHSLKLCGVSLDEPLATNILEASFRTINDVTIDRVHTVTAETLGKLVRKAHPSKSLVFCNHSTLQASEAIVPDLLLSCTASNIAIEPSVSLFHRFFDDAALVRLVISDQAIRRTIRLPLCAVTHNGISKAAQAFYKRCCDVMAEVTAEMRAPQWEIFVSFPSSMLIKRDMIEVPAEMRGQCTVWGYLPYYEDSFVVEVRVGGMNLRIVVESP